MSNVNVNWKTALPAWIPLLLTVLGWAWFGGALSNQQDTNIKDIQDVVDDVALVQEAQTKIAQDVVEQGVVSNTNSNRLDNVELAMNAIFEIRTNVGVIMNDQEHIQSGITRLEGEFKDVRKIAFENRERTITAEKLTVKPSGSK